MCVRCFTDTAGGGVWCQVAGDTPVGMWASLCAWSPSHSVHIAALSSHLFHNLREICSTFSITWCLTPNFDTSCFNFAFYLQAICRIHSLRRIIFVSLLSTINTFPSVAGCYSLNEVVEAQISKMKENCVEQYLSHWGWTGLKGISHSVSTWRQETQSSLNSIHPHRPTGTQEPSHLRVI